MTIQMIIVLSIISCILLAVGIVSFIAKLSDDSPTTIAKGNGDSTLSKLKKIVEDLLSGWESIKKLPVVNVLAVVIGYAILIIVFSQLQSERWSWYWTGQNFFWMSQLGILFIVLLWIFGKKMGKIITILLFIVILSGFRGELKARPFGKPPPKDTGTESVQTLSEKGSVVKVVDTSKLVRYKVKAVWEESVKIGTPSGFKYVEHDWDSAYKSIGNNGRLYWIRLNEDNNQIATEGLLNGKMTLASFSEPARRIEFTSLCILSDKNGNPILNEQRQTTRLPVYLTVEYTKK